MQKDLQNATESVVKRPRGRPRGEAANAQTEWTDDDRAMLARLIASSPVKDETAKERFARRAVEADRQCRQLDGMARNPDEQKALTNAYKNFKSAMDRIHVGEALVEPDDDEEDEG